MTCLLGSEAVLTPDHVFYQRLLASDPIEAAEQADVFLKEDRLDDFLNDVAVPGLMLANYDHMRGVLSNERLTVIANSFSETLDEIWLDGDSAAKAMCRCFSSPPMVRSILRRPWHFRPF